MVVNAAQVEDVLFGNPQAANGERTQRLSLIKQCSRLGLVLWCFQLVRLLLWWLYNSAWMR